MIQLIGFVETLMKILIYLKILKFLISSLLNLANGPAVHCIWKACAPSDIAAAGGADFEHAHVDQKVSQHGFHFL